MNISPEFIGLLAGFFATGAVLPQIIKTIRCKSVSDISIVMFSSQAFGAVLWVTYGLIIASLPVIAWNTVSFILNTTMVVTKLYYGRSQTAAISETALDAE